jgi:hypothetical protein
VDDSRSEEERVRRPGWHEVGGREDGGAEDGGDGGAHSEINDDPPSYGGVEATQRLFGRI